MRILIYGANGFTGLLIVEKAVKLGLQPTVAGRNEQEIKEIAEKFELDSLIFDLSDEQKIEDQIRAFDLVLHCAGPYTITGEPMIDACIATGTHYLDITGELEIFEYCVDRDNDARNNGVLLLPGCGFDIIPTDNLAGLLAEGMQDPNELKIAIYGTGKPSRGTSKSIVNVMAEGNRVMRYNQLDKVRYGKITDEFEFMNGIKRHCVAVPLPDVLASNYAFEIPNITTYYSMKPSQLRGIRLIRPLMIFLKFRPIAGLFRTLIGWFGSDPDEDLRKSSPSFIYGELSSQTGEKRIGHVKTPNAYNFTAEAAALALRKLSKEDTIPEGYNSPSQVLGIDFIREIDGIQIELQTS